jgi:hypothetical protein
MSELSTFQIIPQDALSRDLTHFSAFSGLFHNSQRLTNRFGDSTVWGLRSQAWSRRRRGYPGVIAWRPRSGLDVCSTHIRQRHWFSVGQSPGTPSQYLFLPKSSLRLLTVPVKPLFSQFPPRMVRAKGGVDLHSSSFPGYLHLAKTRLCCVSIPVLVASAVPEDSPHPRS